MSRKILWCKCLTSNSDPKVIGKVYLQYLASAGRIHRLLTCDLGTENTLICTIHQMLQCHPIPGRDSRVIMHHKSARNERAELCMSHLKKNVTGVFITIFKTLEEKGYYTSLDPVDAPCLFEVFNPILERHVASWIPQWNSHRIRKQNNVQFSGYSPNVMFDSLLDVFPPTQFTELNPDLTLDDVARACQISDWRDPVEARPVLDADFMAICEQTLPSPLDRNLRNGSDLYIQLRTAYRTHLRNLCDQEKQAIQE